VRWQGTGHALEIPADAVDVRQFERLALQGGTALRRGDGEAAARALRSALGLWRGSPLDGLPIYPWVLADAARLDHLRLDLMMALYRSGRQADALETYQEAAQALADNHGLWSANIPSGNDCGGSCMPNSSGAGGAGPPNA